jgi:hypothetical protein
MKVSIADAFLHLIERRTQMPKGVGYGSKKKPSKKK